MEMFGHDFDRYKGVQAELEKAEAEKAAQETETSTTVGKAKKGKLVAKSTGLAYQFQIMESFNVPRTEIKKFADPLHWLTYFPPNAIADNNSFGSRINWRRSFMTTDANPYFDTFVRWCFCALALLLYFPGLLGALPRRMRRSRILFPLLLQAHLVPAKHKTQNKARVIRLK